MSNETIKEYLARIGKKGGKARTDAKINASKKSLEKARQSRWGKKGKK